MPKWRDRPEGGNRFLAAADTLADPECRPRFCATVHVADQLVFPAWFAANERRASRYWLERVQAPRRGLFGVLLHIYTFAITPPIVDRVLLLAGRDRSLKVRAEGIDQLKRGPWPGDEVACCWARTWASFEAIRVFSRQAPAEIPPAQGGHGPQSEFTDDPDARSNQSRNPAIP